MEFEAFESFGKAVGQVIKEQLAPLKQKIEDLQQQTEDLQQRVTELENLTEGLK